MIKKYLTPERLALLLLAVLVLLLVYYTFNRFHAVAEARENVEAAQQALDAEKQQLLQLRELEQQGPRLLQQLELFDQLIPEEHREHEVEYYLYQLAYLHGLSGFAVSFESEESFEEYREIYLLVSFESNYFGVVDFIKALKQGKRLFRLDTIELYPLDTAGSKLGAQLRLTTFSRN